MLQSLYDSINFFHEIGKKYLFHGSMKGLHGPIRIDFQKKDKFYDFGAGFYCADVPKSAINLLYPYKADDYRTGNLPPDYIDPYLYTFHIDLSGFEGIDIGGIACALFIAYHRGAISPDTCPEFCESIEAFMDGIDIVRGPISDDKTFLAMQLFLGDHLTVDCLNEVLRQASTGTQYVFRSQELANQLSIIKIKRLSRQTCENLARKYEEIAPIRKNAENKTIKEFRRTGLFLSELVEEIIHQRIVFPNRDKNISVLRFSP